MNWFLYRLVPPRPDFAMTMCSDEQGVMGEHAAYWTSHCDDGTCLIFSPVADHDRVWGVALVRGDTVEEVATLGAADPAVHSGLCTYDVLPLLAPVTGAALGPPR